MNSLPYKISKTEDQLTSRAGLLSVALLMEQLELSKYLDEAFPEPKSNRGIVASSYLETLILMQHQGLFHLDDVKQHLLKVVLHKRKGITLDIDATEIVSQKAEVKWTYNKNPGYMPMVGHVAEVRMVVACDFRESNQPPAKDNLAFH